MIRSLGTSIKACAVSPDGDAPKCSRDPQVHSRVYSSIYGHGLDPGQLSNIDVHDGDIVLSACPFRMLAALLVAYTREHRTLLSRASSIVAVRSHGLAYVECCAPQEEGREGPKELLPSIKEQHGPRPRRAQGCSQARKMADSCHS